MLRRGSVLRSVSSARELKEKNKENERRTSLVWCWRQDVKIRGRSKSSAHIAFCPVPWVHCHRAHTCPWEPPKMSSLPSPCQLHLETEVQIWAATANTRLWRWRKFCPEGPAASLVPLWCVQGDGMSLGNGRRIPSHDSSRCCALTGWV